MLFTTLSEREIKNSGIYNQIKEKHIVISISGSESQETVIPPNLNRVGTLHLKFDDIQDIDYGRFISFDKSQAREILEFVEKHCNSISLIVVQCQAGLSRSVAVASALAKIMNYSDDAIYTHGIPNMFVYITLLDEFFGEKHWRTIYNKMAFQRSQAMSRYLSPATVRLSCSRDKKRAEGIEF